jgi:hypothetical protein
MRQLGSSTSETERTQALIVLGQSLIYSTSTKTYGKVTCISYKSSGQLAAGNVYHNGVSNPSELWHVDDTNLSAYVTVNL